MCYFGCVAAADSWHGKRRAAAGSHSPPPPLPTSSPPPTPTSSPPPPTVDGCTIGIVGAGAGGLYTAYRMVFDLTGANAIAPSSICIFEATNRIGGRILSVRNLGPRGDMVLDAGGYRTFDSISPRTQYLIESRLNLTLACYDPAACLGKVIVGADGERIGYVAFLEVMLERLEAAGVRVFLNHPLTSMEQSGSAISLKFANNGASRSPLAHGAHPPAVPALRGPPRLADDCHAGGRHVVAPRRPAGLRGQALPLLRGRLVADALQ